jgi:hypothetical protein
MAADFDVSATQVNGMLKALEHFEVREAVVARLRPEVQNILTTLWSTRWVPSMVMEEITNAVEAQGGLELIERLNTQMMRDSLGPILAPMLKVALAITGRTPATLFSRLGEAGKTAMRGEVVFAYEVTSPRSGTLTIRYPRPLAPNLLAVWRGVFRFLYELSGMPQGRVEAAEQLEGGREYRFKLAW